MRKCANFLVIYEKAIFLVAFEPFGSPNKDFFTLFAARYLKIISKFINLCVGSDLYVYVEHRHRELVRMLSAHI